MIIRAKSRLGRGRCAYATLFVTAALVSLGAGKGQAAEAFLDTIHHDATAPNGHLLVANGQNGQVVEINPATGKQLAAIWVDNNKAQTPPGSGDLFGLAMTPAGDGFYYVEDEVNTLVLAR